MKKSLLLVYKGGQMELYIGGQRAQLVHIPIFDSNSPDAVVTYTFGEPGVDEQIDDVVDLFRQK
jgi:hypothetical protein